MRDTSIKGRPQWMLLSLGMLAFLGLFVFAARRPGLIANPKYLGVLLALQIAFVGMSHFEEVFFPLLMGIFLWAGSTLPFAETANSLRWLFLGVGAFSGLVIWVKSPRARHFGPFHLVAMFCVLSALVSAIVSEVRTTSLLKVSSLFLLFLYAASGARVAVAGRERKFIAGLVLACEVLVYLAAVCYLVLHYEVFGNPNALGAIIGVVAVPILLWAASVAETRGLKQRRFLALALCGVLLYVANSRASTLAAIVVILVFTLTLRHQRLLLQFAFVSVFFLAIMAVFNPSHMDEMVASFTGRVIYKDQQSGYNGLFGSRLSPWSETVSVVKRRPWFGTGFGTSELGDQRPRWAASSVYTTEGTNREHGNSYLALAEYMGLLGCVPFLVLLLMLVRVLIRIFRWMRRTGSAYHLCIPLALVATAGLVHAFFEDWLFAVGSYLCLFFWVSAFLAMDLIPDAAPARSSAVFQRRGVVASPAAVAHSLR